MSAPPLSESRAEVSALIDTLERFVLTTNLRGVRSTCKELEGKFTNKAILPLVLELGAVQALLGALNQSRRDLLVTETVFSSLLAIGSRPTLMAGNQDLTVSVALLLRPEGLLAVCRAANEHRANLKVLALALRLFADCCRDEQGSRMVVFSPVFQFLLEVVNRYRSNRDLVSLALFTVSYCTIFHHEARVLVVAAKGTGIKSEMYTLCREYANEVDVLEPSMCIFCMVSGDAKLIGKQDELDEIGSIALHALNVFALRTFDEVTNAAAASTGGIVGTTFQNFASRFSTPTKSPPASNGPGVPIVTSSNERRCSSWCLLLLGNLAKINDQVRNQVIQSIVQAGVADTEVRYQRILESLLASCLDDVVSNNKGDEDEEEDFMTFSEDDATFDFLLTGTEEDLIAKVLFCADPTNFLLRAGKALLIELQKTLVSPVSLLGTRLFTLVFAMLQHPLSRRKLSAESVSSIAHNLLPAVRAKSGENGEYFTLLARQLEQKLAMPIDHMVWIPFRAFPLLVDKHRLDELEQMDFTFSLWRTNPKSLCHQITLKMESLYAVVDPTTCCVQQEEENEQNAKLLAFHRNLQIAIKRELLSLDEDSRAGLIECIIDVASYSATSIVGNLDLTMLCLALLHSGEVQHLKLTWKRVRDVYKKVLRELVALSAFEDLSTMDSTMKPPPLLQSPRIPYLEGFLRVMKGSAGCGEESYACFNWWFPNLGKNGDWYSRAAQFTPQPNVQIALSAIANTQYEEEEEEFLSLAKKLEPDWLIEQGESHDALMLQVQIEQLVEGLDALKAWQKRPLPQQLSIEQSGKLVGVLMDELVAKKKLAERNLTAQICLERIVLAPQSSRLFLLAAQATKVEETEFQSKLSKIKLQRDEGEWLVGLDIAPRFAKVPWRGAIAVLNAWVCAPTVLPPSQSMGMLLKFKDELFLEAQQHGLKHLTAEDLIPIVIVALVRSDVLNFFLCSHLHFIKTFLGDDELAKQGEALYYLVTLESAVYQIRKM